MKFLSKHEQIAKTLRQRLLSGQYPLGQRLPTTKALAGDFAVSNNIILKAIHQLSKDGLVEIRPGKSGTYSIVTETKERQGEKSAETDSFTAVCSFQIGEPKYLQIGIEDKAAFQIDFWQQIAKTFHSKHPDIIPKFIFGSDFGTNQDMVIGGINYVTQYTDATPASFNENEAILWEPPDYSESFAAPSQLTGCQLPTLFPIMFQQPVILSTSSKHIPDDASDVIDFIQKVREKSNKPAQYRIWSFMRLLSNRGINIYDWIAGSSNSVDNETLLSELKLYRQHHIQNDLIWAHGDSTGPNTAVETNFNSGVQYLEINSSILGAFNLKQDVKEILYPFKQYADPMPICALVSPRTPYPMEAIEWVNYLLSEEVQSIMAKLKIGFPLRRDALTQRTNNLFIKRFDSAQFVNTHIATSIHTEIYQKIISWEFYHYLNGERDDNVLDLIKAKATHYSKVK